MMTPFVAPPVAKIGCQLEPGVNRVRFTNIAQVAGEIPFVRVRLYDKQQHWVADEMLYGGLDAPIYPVSQLIDPSTIASLACFVDGYSPESNINLFVRTAGADVPGRTTCTPETGLIVDGGPDAQFSAIVTGKNWIAFEILPFINHFLGNERTDFAGDVFSAKLDGGSEQRTIVSGPEGSPAWFLFTNVASGVHRIEFGPWGDGGHPFCLRT
jgi:hypothetical protein